MKRKFVLLLTIAMQQALLFAQTNPLVKYLPDNTSMVISFNPVSLTKKIPGETFRQSAVYREMMKKDSTEVMAFLSTPSVSGIDFSNDLLIAFTTGATEEQPKMSVHLFGSIKNEALFAISMKKMAKKTDSVKIYGTDKILYKENGSPSIAWNNSVFVINLNSGSAMTAVSVPYNDTATQEEYNRAVQRATEKMMKAQRNLCFELLTQKQKKIFGADSRFINQMSAAGDIKIWSNGMQSPLAGRIFGLAGLNKLQTPAGGSKTSSINFENGKIVMQSNSYPDEAVTAVYKKYPTTPVNTDLSRRLPKGKLLGLISTSYNPEMAMELMQKSGLKEMVAEMKGKMPFDLNLITASFGNNMMLAVIKSDDISSEDSLTRSIDGIKLLLAMPIADKVKFDEMRKSVHHLWDSLKNGESGGKMMKELNPFIKYNDTLFVLSLSPDVATAFLNNTGTEPVPDWLQSKSQYPMLININMKEIIKMVLGKKMAGKNGQDEQKLMDMFDQVIMYGGNYENESMNTTMEFKFSNQNENALKQLFDIVNMIAGKNKNAVMNQEKNAKMDSVRLEKTEQVNGDKMPPPPPSKKSLKNNSM